MHTLAAADIVGTTVLLPKRPSGKRFRVRVTDITPITEDTVLVLGDLAYKPGGAYGPLDSRGRFNAMLPIDTVVFTILDA